MGDIIQDGQPVIVTEGLTKCYGMFMAVDHLNLEVKKGEVYGLLGPNGAGKTTTTLMLLGLSEPTAGKAVINGLDCTRNSIEVKRQVGYLPDNVGFYGHMTGRENLRFTGRLNGLTGKKLESRIDELLERVDMKGAADKKAGTYSRGMRQRLGIADVLMKDPQIIIMDEPTLGIDPEGMRELMRLIRDLAEVDKRTLLLSSHQLYQVQKMCDRMGIFVNGRLVAHGTLDELGKEIVGESCTLELAVEHPDEKLENFLENLRDLDELEKNIDMYVIHTDTDQCAYISKWLNANGYVIMRMRKTGNNLDEIYRKYFEKAGEKDGSTHGKTA